MQSPACLPLSMFDAVDSVRADLFCALCACVCLEATETPCGHVFGKMCIAACLEARQSDAACPVCATPVKMNELSQSRLGS